MSALLAQIGLPVLINIFSEALSGANNPLIKSAGKALSDLNEALSRGDISKEDMAELNRHTEQLALLKSEEYRAQISEINQSLRAEIASDDPYVRRMRPTFGYLMALTWAAQMLALAWIIVDDPANASVVMEAFGSLGLIWSVGLSVLGIYVYKRSEDKKVGTIPNQIGQGITQSSSEVYVSTLPAPQAAKPPQGRVYND